MLHAAKSLKGYQLECLDGHLGKAREFYFDDQYWTVRYLVADTGNWLTGNQVLLSPYSLVGVMFDEGKIVVNLTKKQIQESPSLDTDKPVSRQFEEDYHGYYGWPNYWSGTDMWGNYPFIMRDREQWGFPENGERAWDPHLRSTHDVSGYDILAADGLIGHVEDFIIDDETWAIRYLVIARRNWLPGKKVLISPEWIQSVNWGDSNVTINLSREEIKASPEFTEAELLSRDYEAELHEHYDRPGYWLD
jgi:hypothetical protein